MCIEPNYEKMKAMNTITTFCNWLLIYRTYEKLDSECSQRLLNYRQRTRLGKDCTADRRMFPSQLLKRIHHPVTLYISAEHLNLIMNHKTLACES